MDIQDHTHPDALEKYSFWWSEARLIVAAVALIAGGIPPIYMVTPYALYGLVGLGLKLAWLVSGAAAIYLAYRWNAGGRKLFGGSDTKDTAAFAVMVVSGINLGLAGLVSQNIGMIISHNKIVFIVVAAVYVVAAYQLYARWSASGKRMFAGGATQGEA